MESQTVARLLTINDLCRVIGCSRRHIERLRVTGKLPRPCASVGRSPRWRPEDIDQWLQSGAAARR